MTMRQVPALALARLVVFGSRSWRNKQTGKTADCGIANFWRFEGGKVVEFIDVFDSARAVAAATPEPPPPFCPKP